MEGSVRLGKPLRAPLRVATPSHVCRSDTRKGCKIVKISSWKKFGLVRELVIYNSYINDVADDDDDDIDGDDYDSFQGVFLTMSMDFIQLVFVKRFKTKENMRLA